MPRSLLLLAVAALTAACASAPSVCVPECPECREVAVREWQAARSGRSFHTDRAPRVLECSCCKAVITVYDQDGKPRLHCPKCAPHGVDCADCQAAAARAAANDGR